MNLITPGGASGVPEIGSGVLRLYGSVVGEPRNRLRSRSVYARRREHRHAIQPRLAVVGSPASGSAAVRRAQAGHAPRRAQQHRLRRVPQYPLPEGRFDLVARGTRLHGRSLHPGFIYKTPIELDLVVGGRARRVICNGDEYSADSMSFVDKIRRVLDNLEDARRSARSRSGWFCLSLSGVSVWCVDRRASSRSRFNSTGFDRFLPGSATISQRAQGPRYFPTGTILSHLTRRRVSVSSPPRTARSRLNLIGRPDFIGQPVAPMFDGKPRFLWRLGHDPVGGRERHALVPRQLREHAIGGIAVGKLSSGGKQS